MELDGLDGREDGEYKGTDVVEMFKTLTMQDASFFGAVPSDRMKSRSG